MDGSESWSARINVVDAPTQGICGSEARTWHSVWDETGCVKTLAVPLARTGLAIEPTVVNYFPSDQTEGLPDNNGQARSKPSSHVRG